MERTIELPATEPCLSLVHEGCGHLYDSLIELSYEEDQAVREEILESLEEIYVAAAEEDVENLDRVEISFRFE